MQDNWRESTGPVNMFEVEAAEHPVIQSSADTADQLQVVDSNAVQHMEVFRQQQLQKSLTRYEMALEAVCLGCVAQRL